MKGGRAEASFSRSRAEAVARLKRCENVCAIERVRIKHTQDGTLLLINMGRLLKQNTLQRSLNQKIKPRKLFPFSQFFVYLHSSR